MAVRPRKSAGSKNEHRLGLVGRRMVGECGKRFGRRAKVIVFEGEVGHFANEPRQHAAAEPSLTDACIEHRRFVARIRADDENRVRLVDAGNRRIEKVGRTSKLRMELRTILAAVDVGRTELGEQRLEREHFLDRRQIADDRADPGGRCRLDLAGDRGESLRPARGSKGVVDTHVRAVQPLRLKPIDNVPRLVGNPFLVDRIVDARQDAHDLAAARVDPDGRAQGVHDVHRLGLEVLPGSGVERGRFRGQGSDRTQVDDVALQFGCQCVLEIGSDLHVLAAADRAKLGNAGDLGHEPHAARALDAAVHRGLDQGPNELVLDGALVLGEARRVGAIAHRLILQIAFAALVADRAVERMVDEQELHHPLARLPRHLRIGEHDRRLAIRPRTQVFDRHRAGCRRFGRSAFHFDEAHPAVAGDR